MVAERFHAPLIGAEDGLLLTHVVERHRNRSQELYPDVEVLRSAQLLFQTDVELVVVLTPNESHYPLAKEALAAGKHVVLDKPMTITSAEADELIELAEQKGLTLTVFHNRRWDGDFLTVQELIRSNTLGRIVILESHFDRFRPELKGGWREEARPGSGVLYDLGSHLLDQAFQLFGYPKEILADLLRERLEADVDDGFLVVLRYENIRVLLRASCVCAEPKLRFKVRGTKGAWVKYGLDPQEDALKENVRPDTPNWGEEDRDRWGILHHENGEKEKYRTVDGCYPQFYRRLAKALRSTAPAPVDAREARNVIRAVELCLLSHGERRWVEWSG